MNTTTKTRRPDFKYLSGEGKRNRANADLFQAMLCIAWGDGCSVITGHHVSFLFDGDLSTEDEVPSADCVLFDHDIMGKVFPRDYLFIMRTIAPMLRYERENYVRDLICERYPEFTLARDPKFPPQPQPQAA